jgi:hypothetical protein
VHGCFAWGFGVENSVVWSWEEEEEEGLGFWVLSQMSVWLFSNVKRFGLQMWWVRLKFMPIKGFGFSAMGRTEYACVDVVVVVVVVIVVAGPYSLRRSCSVFLAACGLP